MGKSTTNDQNKVTNGNEVYNPNHGSGVRDTVVIPSPIPLNSSVQIQAANLFNDADVNLFSNANNCDKVMITAVSNYGGSSSIFTITRDNYQTFGTAKNGGYGALTVKANSSPTSATNYQVLTVNLSTIDNISGLVTNNLTIDLVFKIDNTRPIYVGSDRIKDTTYGALAQSTIGSGDLLVRLQSGTATKRLYFNPADYNAHKNEANVYKGFVAFDIDGNTNTIVEAKVPQTEFVYVDKYNKLLDLKVSGSNYTKTDINAQSYVTGTGNTNTGFPTNIAVMNGVDNSQAFVSYYIDPNGKFIEFTPLKSSKYLYNDTGRQGHFYIMIRVNDSGNTTDNGIWYPIAVQVDNSNPMSTSPIAASEGAAGEANASYLTPYGVGVLNDGTNFNDTGAYKPAVANDIDIFQTADRSLNQFLFIDTSSALFQDKANKILYNNEYFTISLQEMRASKGTITNISDAELAQYTNSVSGGGANITVTLPDLVFMSQQSKSDRATADSFIFYGLKVVRHKSTQGKYIEALIPVKDTAGGKNNVSLYIKTDNSPLSIRDIGEINTDGVYTSAASEVIGAEKIQVTPMVSNGSTIVNYYVNTNGRFFISPYDLAKDIDTLTGSNAFTSANSNYLNAAGTENAAFIAQLDKLDGQAAGFNNTWKLAASRGEAAQNGILPYDTLSFNNSPQINGAAYGTVTMPTDQNKSFEVVAKKTTPESAPMSFKVSITDGSAASVEVTVQIHIRNNAPYIKDVADWQQGHVYYMRSNFNSLGLTTNSESAPPLVTEGDDLVVDPNDAYYNEAYSIREFTVRDLANDIETPGKLTFYGTDIYIETRDFAGGDPTRFVSLANGSDYVDVSYDVSSLPSGSRGRVLKIVAKSSTQALQGGLFVRFEVSDGQSGVSVFRLQIEVLNSDVVVNNDSQNGYGFNAVTETINEVEATRSVWEIDTVSNADLTASRYLVSNAALFNKVPSFTARNARVLVADNDVAQTFALVCTPGTTPKPFGSASSSTLVNAQANNTLTAGAFGSNAVIYDYPFTAGTVDWNSNDFKNMLTIHYYDVDGKEINAFTDGVEYTDWAIEYKPVAGASYKPEQLSVALYVKDTAATGGDGAVYKGIRDGTDKEAVAGKRILLVNIRIGGLGIINTFSRFTAPVDANWQGSGNTKPNQYYTSFTPEGGQENRTYADFSYDALELSGSNAAPTAITTPISYYALPQSVSTAQIINSGTDLKQFKADFIGFKSTASRSKADATEILKSVTLSDGTSEWTGDILKDNPYVDITVVNQAEDTVSFGSYLNKYAGTQDNEGHKNFVDASAGETILENTFGLKFMRKGVRSNGQLTLKIELQQWVLRDGTYVRSDREGTTTTAIVPISVLNQKISLTNGTAGANSNTVDLRMTMGEPEGLLLADSYEKDTAGSYKTATYADPDKFLGGDNKIVGSYKDKAYYLYSSISNLADTRLAHMFANKEPNNIDPGNQAYQALYGYFGESVPSAGDYGTAYDTIAAKFVNNSYEANPGYTDYFTVAQAASSTDGNLLSITPKHKTTFDIAAAAGNTGTDDDKKNSVIAAAADRHLVAEYLGGTVTARTSWKIYYPFKVIVYDQYGNSGWENSSYQVLNVNVLIENSTPTVNPLFTNSSNKIAVSLTKGDPVSFSLKDLIIDKDMIASGDKYLTKEGLGTMFPNPGSDPEDRLGLETADYLVYTGFVEGKDPTIDGSDANVYNYATGNDAIKAQVNLIGQTLIITATERPATNSEIGFILYIGDNNGAYAALNFSVTVSNKIPYAYDADLGSTYNITMKSGDYFYLAATSFDKFNNAASQSIGYYNDASRRKSPLEKSAGSLNQPLSAYTQSDFDNFIWDNAAADGNHGLLAVSDDDTPWTLRFNADARAVNSAYTSGNNNYFEITPYDEIPAENGDKPVGKDGYPLVYCVTAKGAIKNANLRFTVRDFEQNSYLTINVNVTVVSTPPVAITDADTLAKAGLTMEADADGNERTVTYKTTMRYGEKRTFKTTDFVTDVDALDKDKLYFYNAFNNYLSINGDRTGKTSSINFTFTEDTRVSGTANIKSFQAECTNVFTTDRLGRKPYDELTFYVMDPSGVDLNGDAILVTLRIYTEFMPVKSDKIDEQNGRYDAIPVSIKSREAYDANNQPQTIRLIKTDKTDTEKTAAIIDPDYGSSGISYNVMVYALLSYDPTEDKYAAVDFNTVYTYDRTVGGTRGVFDADNAGASLGTASDHFLLRMNNKTIETNAESPVYQYVDRYFDINISSDGTQLSFTPKMKTANNIMLYVEVSKAVDFEETGADYAQSETDITAGTVYSLTVQNSAPKVINNSNGNSNMTDETKYLEFFGVKGDSVTYPLYNADVRDLALFYDTDLGDAISYKPTSLDNMVISKWYETDQDKAQDLGRNYEGKYTVDPAIAKVDKDGKLIEHTIDSNYKPITAPYQAPIVTVTAKTVDDKPSVVITINRKMSNKQVEPAVVPLRITGVDTSNATATNIVWIYVGNTSPVLKEVTEETAKYRFADESEEDSDTPNWVLRATIEKGTPLTIKTSDIVTDEDGDFDVLKFVEDGYDQASLHQIDRDPEKTLSVKGTGANLSTTLFSITTDDNNRQLKIVSNTTLRGAVGTAYLCFGDNGDTEGMPSRTPLVTIVLTVANSAPVAKADEELVINIKGGENPDGENDQFTKSYFSILDYVTDANAADMTQEGSYLRIGYIDSSKPPIISTGTTEPGGEEGGSGGGEETGLFIANIETEADDNPENWKKGIAASQVFYLRPIAKRYGRQQITITVYDDGGDPVAYPDYKTVNITLTINVARAASEQQPNELSIAEGRKSTVTASSILDTLDSEGKVVQYSIGYTLDRLEFDATAENMLLKGKDTDINNKQHWFLQAKVDKIGTCSVTAVFIVAGKEESLAFTVNIVENVLPVLRDEFKDTTKIVYPNMLEEGFYKLQPNDLFFDSEGGEMTFVSVESTQKMICEGTLDSETNTVLLKFNANRPVDIKVKVMDETQRPKEFTFNVQYPEGSKLNFFASMVVMIQQNMMWFLVIVGGVLLLLVVMIIIIVTVRKKKKMRKEIEALLVSEMELEEQMLKLAASPNPTFYQSYGYLPPTQQVQNNPGFMLGNGHDINTSGTIGLNPGQDPNDPGMTPPTTGPNTNDLDNF